MATDWKHWLAWRQKAEPEQAEAWRGIACLLQWMELRAKWEGEKAPRAAGAVGQVIAACRDLPMSQFLADIIHSSLLRRLLEGKEPLPVPPPLAFSYPWCDLIEKGRADQCDVFIPQEGDFLQQGWLAINQSSQWRVVEKHGDEEFIVTDGRNGNWRLWRSRVGREPFDWSLERS